MNALKKAEEYFKKSKTYTSEMPLVEIAGAAEIMFNAYLNGKQFFFMGNGGSFATASHAYIDFMKGTKADGKKSLKVISLTDMSALTAIGNDLGFENVFKYQLQALLEKGDIVVGISASGNSVNVIEAVKFANEKGAITIGWLGFGGGKLKDLVKHPIIVPSAKPEYCHAEDMHLKLDHFFVEYLREEISRLD